MYEAQQAHHFGLQSHLALASVTSVPATAAGLAHRIGTLQVGVDADVVLWDSHPLHLGATPVGVWIDGIQQLPLSEEFVETTKKGPEWRKVPEVPDWDHEREQAIEWEGLPPLEANPQTGKVVFHNVSEVWTKGADGRIEETFSARSDVGQGQSGTVVVEDGRIICTGSAESCLPDLATDEHKNVNLHRGAISPGFMSFGSQLGLEEISAEVSTADGPLYDPFVANVPSILDDVGGIVRAVDALMFQTRDALFVFFSA
jgi:imidazolonepropionase-like amidohydrolase